MVVSRDQKAEALGGERLIERSIQIPEGPTHNGDGIHQPFAVHELKPEEAEYQAQD